MLPKLSNLITSDQTLNRVQANVQTALDPLLTNPILDFNIVKVSLLAGDNFVNHLLNRAPLGWFVVRQRGPATLYDKQDQNQTPKLNFLINSSASVSVDIYFF